MMRDLLALNDALATGVASLASQQLLGSIGAFYNEEFTQRILQQPNDEKKSRFQLVIEAKLSQR